MKILCNSLLEESISQIELGNVSPDEACQHCWMNATNLFAPWMTPMFTERETELLLPCTEYEVTFLDQTVMAFCLVLADMEIKFSSFNESVLPSLWTYYINNLAVSYVPQYIINCYHSSMVNLPWQMYYPDQSAMNSMIEVICIIVLCIVLCDNCS
jgi:hypothetical protein